VSRKLKLLLLSITALFMPTISCADNRVRVKPKVEVDYTNIENREIRDVLIYRAWETRKQQLARER